MGRKKPGEKQKNTLITSKPDMLTIADALEDTAVGATGTPTNTVRSEKLRFNSVVSLKSGAYEFQKKNNIMLSILIIYGIW